MHKTIIIANRLPVKIVRNDQGLAVVPSEGGLATGLGSIYQQQGNIWVGWPGIISEDAAEQAQIRAMLQPLHLVPVFLDQRQLAGFYEGFSNEVIWPICHYRPSYAVYNEDHWSVYQQVNYCFAEVVETIFKEQDIVWIHDYQLMLLPDLLRTQHQGLAIAYFQHIPFPSHEIFRLIPWRNQLLKGMLGADLIGFHTYDDSRYFIDCCMHLLDLKTHQNRVKYAGRSIYVEAYPMGIDSLKFETLAASLEVQLRAIAIKETFHQAEIILSIDRLDYSKGIIERINAYEQLLIQYPEFRKQVVYYMLVVPSREAMPQYKRLKDEIDRLVGAVNALYGSSDWMPIAYFYTSYPIEELSALYLAASVCLVTPIRDGMNLVCKEFIASKKGEKGVLILSELAGAAKELIDAIQVNPCEINGVAQALAQSLTMPEVEQRRRLDASGRHVATYTVQHWAQEFLRRLGEIKTLQQADLSRQVGPTIFAELLQQYQRAQQRVLFLDYDGSLVPFFRDVDQAKPGEELLQLLRGLQAEPQNKVVIISGRTYETLQEWFSDIPLTLIGEHGAWTNHPDGLWHAKGGLSNSWKGDCLTMMQQYVDRTPGAFIEEKTYSIAFHYRKVQKGLGRLRALELMDQLRYLSAAYGLQLMDGDDVIELKSAEVNKGRAALSFLADYHPDFILAIGDDVTDEEMFSLLPANTFSIKVGTADTAAAYFVEQQIEVPQLLRRLLTASRQ